MDEAAALDAYQVWCEGEGEEVTAPDAEVRLIWMAAWAAAEAVQAERGVNYGTEARHDRPRPFWHQHYHAHLGAATVPGHSHADFSHPHRHGREDDHHR